MSVTFKCDTGMSVENLPAVVNIKSMKGLFIAHEFSTGWAVGVVKSGEGECFWPVAVKYKPETYGWTHETRKITWLTSTGHFLLFQQSKHC
jgi:hypothetical protein